jgi:nitrite reductase/ring-hydroxylating ferredoxin subunit
MRKSLEKCEHDELKKRGTKLLDLLKICDLEVAPSPGSLKEFKVGTLEILVINIEGKFFCTNARCPHAGGAPLSEGTLEGIVLTCPWHEAQFRVTDGQLLRGPATENLPVYRSIIKENSIFIEA